MQACFEEKIQSLDKDMLNSFLAKNLMINLKQTFN